MPVRARYRAHEKITFEMGAVLGLDKYGQFGAVTIYSLPAGLRLETGIAGQYNDENGDELLNYTYQIILTWGEAFAVNFLKPRIRHQ